MPRQIGRCHRRLSGYCPIVARTAKWQTGLSSMRSTELLGGAGDVLANSQSDPYLSQAVLDLQFGLSAVVGYDGDERTKPTGWCGSCCINAARTRELCVGARRMVPPILVETGFISNHGEERLLASDRYQRADCRTLYTGVAYTAAHRSQPAPQGARARRASKPTRARAITAAN